MGHRCCHCDCDHHDDHRLKWDHVLLFLASELRRVERPRKPHRPTLTLLRIERRKNMPTAVYTLGLPASTDPNTVSFIGSLTIGNAAPTETPVTDQQEVMIPVGSAYVFTVTGVNAAGDRGPVSDPAVGVAGDPNAPAKPTAPTLTFKRVDQDVPVPGPTPTPTP